MPEAAAIIYALAGLILIYKIGRFVRLGPPPAIGKDWL